MKKLMLLFMCAMVGFLSYGQDKAKSKQTDFTQKTVENSVSTDKPTSSQSNNLRNDGVFVEGEQKREFPNRRGEDARTVHEIEKHPMLIKKIGLSSYESLSLEDKKKLEFMYYRSYRIVQGTNCEKVKDEDVDISNFENMRKQSERVVVDYDRNCDVKIILLSQDEVNSKLSNN